MPSVHASLDHIATAEVVRVEAEAETSPEVAIMKSTAAEFTTTKSTSVKNTAIMESASHAAAVKTAAGAAAMETAASVATSTTDGGNLKDEVAAYEAEFLAPV